MGGKHSNNTPQLGLLAESRGLPWRHVEAAAEIDPNWVAPFRVVGLTTGTSTPDTIIQDVHAALIKLNHSSKAGSIRAQDKLPPRLASPFPWLVESLHAQSGCASADSVGFDGSAHRARAGDDRSFHVRLPTRRKCRRTTLSKMRAGLCRAHRRLDFPIRAPTVHRGGATACAEMGYYLLFQRNTSRGLAGPREDVPRRSLHLPRVLAARAESISARSVDCVTEDD